jgi:hypothetical protein
MDRSRRAAQADRVDDRQGFTVAAPGWVGNDQDLPPPTWLLPVVSPNAMRSAP